MTLQKKKKILGVWDLRLAKVTLGALLIFVEELLIQQQTQEADLAEICFLGCGKQFLVPDIADSNQCPKRLEPEMCIYSDFLASLQSIRGIGSFYFCDSISGLQTILKSDLYAIWPELEPEGGISQNYEYNTTLYIQEFCRKKGFIPFFCFKEKMVNWTREFFNRHIGNNLPVIVHLKNNPLHPIGASNANFDAWFEFINSSRNIYPNIRFVLIGNEKIDLRICNLPNIVIARELGSDLSRDLALIRHAFAFMGMTGGPCQVALFSDVPYVIYKNPDHHAKEMVRELRFCNTFSFAGSLQRFLRAYENSDGLLTEFTDLYMRTENAGWQQRFLKRK